MEKIVDTNLTNNLYLSSIRNAHRTIRERQTIQQNKGQHGTTSNSPRRNPVVRRHTRRGPDSGVLRDNHSEIKTKHTHQNDRSEDARKCQALARMQSNWNFHTLPVGV